MVCKCGVEWGFPSSFSPVLLPRSAMFLLESWIIMSKMERRALQFWLTFSSYAQHRINTFLLAFFRELGGLQVPWTTTVVWKYSLLLPNSIFPVPNSFSYEHVVSCFFAEWHANSTVGTIFWHWISQPREFVLLHCFNTAQRHRSFPSDDVCLGWRWIVLNK